MENLDISHKNSKFMEKANIGDLTWWKNVVEGKQDPFEKMKWAKGVKGAGQLDAVPNQQELPDDHKLEL